MWLRELSSLQIIVYVYMCSLFLKLDFFGEISYLASTQEYMYMGKKNIQSSKTTKQKMVLGLVATYIINSLKVIRLSP